MPVDRAVVSQSSITRSQHGLPLAAAEDGIAALHKPGQKGDQSDSDGGWTDTHAKAGADRSLPASREAEVIPGKHFVNDDSTLPDVSLPR